MIDSLGHDWTKLSHKDENSKMWIFLVGGPWLPGCLYSLSVGKAEDKWSQNIFTLIHTFLPV